MITEEDVKHIAGLADITVPESELPAFTKSFNDILAYFDILDTLEIEGSLERRLVNVFREDEPRESLSQEDALKNSHDPEDGYIRAPKVV
ncbi:MAG TPA: Asp-tRNA(Asn)/Glu-tRNA(Gln) amidotransferase subunit GatC [Methanocorpusculum sp.]|nr:Asp-tRNA(Asn)/Glu-tRNA(Gln) amidotransferase subunit GatC [Methanocorpusculum sp.]